MSAFRVSCIALSLVLLACGDDGGSSSSSDSDGSSGTGSGTSTPDPTNAVTSTPNTTNDDTSTGGGGGSEAGSGEESGSGPGPGESGGGTADTGEGSGTGAAGPCGDYGDEKSCTADEGCVWLGNPQNGMCVGTDADACAGLEMQQACNMHPACAWDMAAGTCGPA